MASMMDALDETMQEPKAKLKIAIFTLPVFAAVFFFKGGKMDLFYLCLVPAIIVLLGTLTRVCNNVMQCREVRLPTWNVFTLIFDTIRTLIAMLPAIVINGAIVYYLVTKAFTMIAVEWVQMAANYITYAVLASILVTVFMMYAKRFKMGDTWDIMGISNSCIDVMIQLIWMSIQLLFIDALIFGSITYLFYVFLDKTLSNWMLLYVWSAGGVFSIMLAGNYLGQLNHEALHTSEELNREKQLKKELEAAKKEARKLINPMENDDDEDDD